MEINDRLGFGLEMRQPLQRRMHPFALGSVSGRAAQFRAQNCAQRHPAKTQAGAGEELPASLEEVVFEEWIHGCVPNQVVCHNINGSGLQFRVNVSSKFKIMFATIVYAANSAGFNSGFAFDSPCKITFLADSTSFL